VQYYSIENLGEMRVKVILDRAIEILALLQVFFYALQSGIVNAHIDYFI